MCCFRSAWSSASDEARLCRGPVRVCLEALKNRAVIADSLMRSLLVRNLLEVLEKPGKPYRESTSYHLRLWLKSASVRKSVRVS